MPIIQLNIRGFATHPADKMVAGIYLVDIANYVPREHFRTAATDIFLAKVGVQNPASFKFTAQDDQGQKIFPQKQARPGLYTNAGYVIEKL
jgi:hypothetical protein